MIESVMRKVIFNEIRAAIKELTGSQKESDRQLKETARQLKEAERLLKGGAMKEVTCDEIRVAIKALTESQKETGRQLKETARQLKETAGDTFRECVEYPEMVVVPAGSFIMGSPADDEDGYYVEDTPHQVTISKPFAVGKYPVTRGQFYSFYAATEYEVGAKWRNPGWKQSDAHPVVNISWDDAQEYIYWLSEKTGHEYRLLTEAEWEYAARAGTTTLYYFGDTISPSQARYSEHDRNSHGTVEVGSYPPNDFGLYDMHGNVSEWVEDYSHCGYKGAPTDGSAWLTDCDSDAYRVLRGGDWWNYSKFLRSASRQGSDPMGHEPFRGFRVARTLES